MGTRMKKLTHRRDDCIGCGSCQAIAPELFGMNDTDGKADMKNANKKGNYFVREVDEVEEEKARKCESACPTKIIRVEE